MFDRSKALRGFIALSLFFISHPILASPSETPDRLIRSQFGCVNSKCFELLIAANPTERKVGLMHVKYLDPNHGMLFIFEKSKIHHFWMKNTWVPLDIIWIDERFKIVDIHENARPNSMIILTPKKVSLYALEVNAGEVKKNAIKIGDTFTFD